MKVLKIFDPRTLEFVKEVRLFTHADGPRDRRNWFHMFYTRICEERFKLVPNVNNYHAYLVEEEVSHEEDDLRYSVIDLFEEYGWVKKALLPIEIPGVKGKVDLSIFTESFLEDMRSTSSDLLHETLTYEDVCPSIPE